MAVILLLGSMPLLAQSQESPRTVVRRFSLTPQKHHLHVRGITIGISAHSLELTDTLYTRVDGLNLEIGPMGIIGGLWGTMFGFAGGRDDKNRRVGFFARHGFKAAREMQYPRYGTHIHGVSISLGGLTEDFSKGLIINGLSGFSYTMSGVQISGLLNESYQTKGVSIAGLVNHATRAHGLQIGLINNCRTGKVVQIGLFNRIGNRIVPFVNLRFGKEPDLGEEYAKRNRRDRHRRV